MTQLHERLNLDPLDPGSRDPGFWLRFHGRVLARAEDELERRRMIGEWSVPGVVFHWRKALASLTLLAAALAGIFVLGHEEPGAPLSPVALEDVLIEGVSGDPIPTVLGRSPELEEVAFLTSAGGFLP
jgi:hypothetical protein